jgi:hypothetical protein
MVYHFSLEFDLFFFFLPFVSSLPFYYLGLLLGASFKEKSIWDSVIEKV